MTDIRNEILDEIRSERSRQDDQWGGPDHDDLHDSADWWGFIQHQHDEVCVWDHRARLIRVAALAIAAVESFDRKAAHD